MKKHRAYSFHDLFELMFVSSDYGEESKDDNRRKNLLTERVKSLEGEISACEAALGKYLHSTDAV